MGKITIIAAIGKNGELGKNNNLIWSIPEDLKFFRDNTIGKTIVMGLNTLKSLPKMLPNRKHVVLAPEGTKLDDEIVLFHNLDELIKYIISLNEEVMIIGGAMVYSQMIKYADKMILTEINCESEADVYFPEFSLHDWNRDVISNHKLGDIEYSHVVYDRK